MTQNASIDTERIKKTSANLKNKTTHRYNHHPKRNSSASAGKPLLVTVERKKSIYYHRSRIDIIAHILNTAEQGAKKTHIMYQCNLSYRQLTGYLTLLNDMQLLTRSQKAPSTYQATQKGKNFTKAYKNMKAILTSPT